MRTMRTAAMFFLLLSIPGVIFAEDRPRQPLSIAGGVYVAGTVADVWSTQRVLSRGGYEANPLLPKSIVGIAATKTVVSVGVLFAMRQLDTHGHPKIARALGFIGGATGGVIAVRNAR